MNDAGKAHDDILAVGRHEIALRIQNQRAVRPQPVQADGKELLDFARIIFVGVQAGDEAALVVALHVQIQTHRRMQRDGFEQRAEIAEGIVEQHVVIGGQARWRCSASTPFSDTTKISLKANATRWRN